MASAAHAKPTLGIDLGTTFCAVAYMDRAGKPVTIPNAEGELTTPSVILFEKDGNVVVGREARAAAIIEPQSVVDYVKREMGEPVYSRRIHGKSMSPAMLSGLILKKLKQDAESKIGAVGGAVITVPAYFDEARRQATTAAGKIAGLKVLDILNEPTAAALAYAFRDFLGANGQGVSRQAFTKAMEVAKPHTALIYDLGGGTFDVTILRIIGTTLMVLATDGDVRLGGHDWDMRIVDYAAEQFKQAYGSDPRQEPQSLQGLLMACENAKRNLSQRTQTRLAVTHAGHTLPVDLGREKFEEMSADLLYRTERRLSRVLQDAGLSWSQIDQVLTVGGSTRMPQVLAMLQRVTGKPPNVSLAPDEVVAHGAAIHAAIRVVQSGQPTPPPSSPAPPAAESGPELVQLEGDSEAISAIAPPAEDDLPVLAVADDDEDEPIVLDEEAAPAKAQDDDGLIILDEPVEADGPAAANTDNDLTGVLEAIHTINVNAHSLGVVLKMPDGKRINSILVPRNTPLPTSVTRRYGTVVENQTAVTVSVVEGESTSADDCMAIGRCQISPLPWGLRKGSTIYVTFSYDNSGRLHVKAVEATTGTQAATVIERQALNPRQVEEARQSVEKTTVL